MASIISDAQVALHEEIVKQIALKLFRETGIKPTCERCFYLTDPTCPDFPHICTKEAEG